MIQALGMDVRGELPEIEISGSPSGHIEWTCRPDRVEAASLLTAAIMTGGELTVEGAAPFDIPQFVGMARDIGADCTEDGNQVRVVRDPERPLRPALVVAGSEPHFSSDWSATTVLMLATCSVGTSVIADLVFPERMQFANSLRHLGLDNIDIHTARTRGRLAGVAMVAGATTKRLRSGMALACSDLRGNGAQVLAALVTCGELRIPDDFHLRRGYEDLPGQLSRIANLEVTRA